MNPFDLSKNTNIYSINTLKKKKKTQLVSYVSICLNYWFFVWDDNPIENQILKYNF